MAKKTKKIKKNTLWDTGDNEKLAKRILADYRSGTDPMTLVYNMIDITAVYEDGYDPSGEMDHSDRMHTVSDHSNDIIKIIKKSDKKAAKVLQEAASDFDGW